jgi:uncharacterized membrane protein (DUF106 family)
MLIEVASLVTSVLIGIIGFFLKETMTDMKEMKKCVAEMRVKLSVIENDYLNKHNTMSSRFDDLNSAVKDLTNEIKLLNKEIQNKLN